MFLEFKTYFSKSQWGASVFKLVKAPSSLTEEIPTLTSKGFPFKSLNSNSAPWGFCLAFNIFINCLLMA